MKKVIYIGNDDLHYYDNVYKKIQGVTREFRDILCIDSSSQLTDTEIFFLLVDIDLAESRADKETVIRNFFGMFGEENIIFED